MHIDKSYKYKLNNIIYVSGILPKDAEIIEIMEILNAEEDYELQRILDNEIVGNSIWLRNGDVQENYKEIKKQNKDILNVNND